MRYYQKVGKGRSRKIAEKLKSKLHKNRTKKEDLNEDFKRKGVKYLISRVKEGNYINIQNNREYK